MWRWLKRISLGLLALVLLALGTLYGWSQSILAEPWDTQPRAIAYTENPDELARGERLAQVFGCFHGCHGADMEGDVFFEEPWVARVVAPNLTQAVRRLTPEQFEAIVRQGVMPDGKGTLGMPSASFATMTDRDLGAIYSFISAYPEQTQQDFGKTSIGLLGRLGLVLGEFRMQPAQIDDSPWVQERLQDPLAHGAYLARNACSECHGLDLEGSPGFAPPLLISKAYNRARFGRLLATGTGLDEQRDLGLMARVAQYRLTHLEPPEVDALHAYLLSR